MCCVNCCQKKEQPVLYQYWFEDGTVIDWPVKLIQTNPGKVGYYGKSNLTTKEYLDGQRASNNSVRFRADKRNFFQRLFHLR